MKLSGSEVLFPEYATPSEASANSPRGSVLICANPVFVLIPPRRPRPVSAAQQPAFVDAPGAQFRKDLRYPQKPSSGRWLRRGQRFFRNWGQEGNIDAGTWGRDEIRNLTGTLTFVGFGTGIFSHVIQTSQESRYQTGVSQTYKATLDASSNVPTGPENVPPHVWQPVILYLGRAAQV